VWTALDQRLKLKYNDPLSDRAFNFNLRPHTSANYKMAKKTQQYSKQIIARTAGPSDNPRHVIDTHVEPSSLESNGTL
jgi:hypothetical protein